MRTMLSITCVTTLLWIPGGDLLAGPPAAAPTPATSAASAPTIRVVSPAYRVRVAALESTGKVVFNEEQLVRVAAPATGRVVKVSASLGELAERGRPLATIDSPDLGAAKADYAKAVAEANRARQASDLARDLFEARAVSQKERQEAESDHRKATAERERAAARLAALGVPESQLPAIADHIDAGTLITIRAPRSGTIVERNVSPGQVVAYGQSDTPVSLFVIADLSTMWVLADVYEPDVSKVRPGQPVSVTLPCCPDERYRGTVLNIADAVDRETRTVKVRAALSNPGRALKAEMSVRVTIDTDSSRVLTLPREAVQRRGGHPFVFLDSGKDRYERRPIQTGAEFDGVVEIVQGLVPTDRVVGRGGILLRDGGR